MSVFGLPRGRPLKTSSKLSVFLLHALSACGLPPPPCRRPHLALDTAQLMTHPFRRSSAKNTVTVTVIRGKLEGKKTKGKPRQFDGSTGDACEWALQHIGILSMILDIRALCVF